MDPRFREHLDRFLMTTLAPANLVPKTIAGKVVKSKEMVDYFSKYLEIFNGDEIPEPKSIFESTAEVNTGCLKKREPKKLGSSYSETTHLLGLKRWLQGVLTLCCQSFGS